MTDQFERYLAHARGAGAKTVRTWSDLIAWLEANTRKGLQPPPRRLGVVPPPITTTRRGGVRHIHGVTAPQGSGRGWERTVNHRQRVTLALATVSTTAILLLSRSALQAQNMPATSMKVYLVVYGLMTLFMTSNFFKLVLGTWHMLAGPEKNPWHPAHMMVDPRPGVRCAILFPVYHEDAARVAAGMAATWESIRKHRPDLANRFDLMLLSDSRRTEHWIAEQAAVHALRRALPDAAVYYRHRASNSNSKMGNIADFCRRWGQNYEYMLVMDADSLMDGEAVVALLCMMEGNPLVGILQTNPKPILRESLFGRMQQFAGRLYGSVFSWGLQAIFMGQASYIGHNAMLRVAPFTEHCMLPELSGPKPWGGKPLSHDILESALMARAGYEVWFLPAIEGSYEEVPANLMGFLARERRWMQGNLQHIRFMGLRGLKPIHRETLIGGAMSYMSAPLWAVFLIVSAFGLVNFLTDGHFSLIGMRQLELPMMMLLASSIVFLFMPRALAIAVNIRHNRAKGYGGKDKLLWSVLLETIFSFFFAPVMMAFISRFVWLWAKRRSITWGTQQRNDAALPWRDCLDGFGWLAALGIICWCGMIWGLAHISDVKQGLIFAASGGWISPRDLLLWYFPIITGFALSPVIARFTSRTFPALLARGLFMIPEEQEPPEIIRELLAWHQHMVRVLPDPDKDDDAIQFALCDPGFYLDHRPSTRIRPLVAEWLLPRIHSRGRLDARETLLAIGERSCFDAIHRIAANEEEYAPSAPRERTG